MKIDVLTIFPEMFGPVIEDSILGKARKKQLLDVKVTQVRDYTLNKHKKTDDTPFGGGAGMVMTAEPFFNALNAIGAKGKKIIYMSPRGSVFTQKKAEELATLDGFVILCGHYEGIDQRVLDYWDVEEISIGDYILTGGELPAMVLIDGVARNIEGVLGSSAAHDEESICSGLLEYPQYTKPREYEEMTVPEVLVCGNHLKIHQWQLEQSLALTYERRPDLFALFLEERVPMLSKPDQKIVKLFLEKRKGYNQKT